MYSPKPISKTSDVLAFDKTLYVEVYRDGIWILVWYVHLIVKAV